METLPNIHDLQDLDTDGRAAVLDKLFEPSTQLHTLSVGLLHERKFASYRQLIEAVGKQMHDLLETKSTSDNQWLDSILSSHPRLGEKKVESERSQAEQTHLQSEDAGQDTLSTLNTQYEAQFPGLRFVAFVNGRAREVIKEELKNRIRRNDQDLERKENIEAMCHIAIDRAQKDAQQ